MDGAVANLTETVNRLNAVGAKNIFVATRATRPVLSSRAIPWTLPDLDPGTPGVQNPELNDASGNFLNAAIRGLVPVLDSGVSANLAVFDADLVIREIIANSGANSFLPYDDSGSAYCVNGADCSMLINWDGAHKTSAVHAVMADAFIDRFGIVAVPLPAGGIALSRRAGVLRAGHQASGFLTDRSVRPLGQAARDRRNR